MNMNSHMNSQIGTCLDDLNYANMSSILCLKTPVLKIIKQL